MYNFKNNDYIFFSLKTRATPSFDYFDFIFFESQLFFYSYFLIKFLFKKKKNLRQEKVILMTMPRYKNTVIIFNVNYVKN